MPLLFLVLFFMILSSNNVFCENLQNFSLTPTSTLSGNLEEPVKINATQHAKIKTLMLCIGDNKTLISLSKIIKFDLEFTDQLEVDLKKTDQDIPDKTLAKLFNDGVSLCVYLKNSSFLNQAAVDVTIKEPSTGTILYNKTFAYSEENLILDAHNISDKLMIELTGQKGPMLSTLAYCKQISKRCKAICIADYACKQEKVLYSSKMINLAPRWHTQAPMLFFSQLTKENNRLMALDLKTKKIKIVCSYEGLNMQPSFSEDGAKAVLCLSGRNNSELYLYDQVLCNTLKRKVFKQLTHNGGNNSSPCYLPNGNVIFCSDFETGDPQIYCLNPQTKQVARVTNGNGYCAAPSYCKKNNSIVFCRLKQGAFQLCTIALSKTISAEKQITHDSLSKQEPVWSECGNYIAFSTDCFNIKKDKNIPQIAVLNIQSGKIRVLTTDDKIKSFPCWANKTYY
jgi:tol-pal system beta propeller repeat protein TolB